MNMLNIKKSLLRFKLPMSAAKRLLSEVSTEWLEARPFEAIPRETFWHLVRNGLPGGKYYKLDMTEIVLAMKEENGDIFVMPPMLGRPSIVTTYNPEDFERVYRNEGTWPERPGSKLFQYHRQKHSGDFFQGVEGLMTTQGKKWGDFRSKVNPVLMQPKNVRIYLDNMSQINKQFIERIKHIRDPQTLEVPANFEDYINRWTLESVSVVALGKHLGLLKHKKPDPEAALLFKSLNEFFKYTCEMEMTPSLWRWFATPKFKKLMSALDNIQTVTVRYVAEAVEHAREKQKIGLEGIEESMLEKFLTIDKKLASVMAMDLLMAGVDTTTSAFTAAMLCIAKNPEKQVILRKEVLRILPNKDSEFTEGSMKNMPYLRACIKESMRLYPVVVANVRVTYRDTVLSGYRVPKGTFISMVPITLLKNENYFSRPNEFLPERWLRDKQNPDQTSKCSANELKVTNPFVYLPFGFGPRMCIGKRIVDMELELGLARIIRNFQVEFNHPTENAFKPLLINVPNIPLQFKFIDIK